MKNNALYLLLLATFFCSQIAAQNPNTHKKTSYVDSVGNYYTAPNLGFGLLINTPTAPSPIRLNNQQPPKFQNPVVLQEMGIYQIKIQKGTGAPEAFYEIRIDGIAPTTAHIFDEKAPKIVNAQNTYFADGLSINLQTKDDMVGAKSTFYAINDTNFVPYKQPIELKNQGSYTLSYYSIDKVGNVETPKTTQFTIDASPPSTQVSRQGNYVGNVMGTDVVIKLQAEDELSGVKELYYTLDGTTFLPYTTSIASGALSDGTHTITYYATDKVGNREATKAYTFYTDNVPAYARYTINGTKFISDNIYISEKTTIAIDATDNKSGVAAIAYSIDGTPPRAYTQPFFLDSKKKQQTLNYYATDSVGNASINKYEVLNIVVDNQVPTCELSLIGPQFNTRDTLFISPKTTIMIAAEDELSQIKEVFYKVNNGDFQKYKDKFTLKDKGFIRLIVTATDNIGNVKTVEKSFFNDDVTPEMNYQLSTNVLATDTLNGESYLRVPKYCKLYIIASDDKTNVEETFFQVDNGVEQSFKSPISLPVGLHTINYRAMDKTMNVSVGEVRLRVVEE